MIEVIKSAFFGCVIFELSFLYLSVLFCESSFFNNILNIICFIISIKIGFLFSKIIDLCKFNLHDYIKTFENWYLLKKINLIASFIVAFFLIIFLNFPFLKYYQMYCVSNYNNIKILFLTGGILGFEIGIIKTFINLKFDNFFNFFVCLFFVVLSYYIYIYEIYLFVKMSIYYIIIVALINLLKFHTLKVF